MADINLSRSVEINWKSIQGNSFAPPPVSFTINGSAESFAGVALKMYIKKGSETVKELNIGAGIAVSANALQYSMSEKLPVATYWYWVDKIESGDIVSTIQHGILEIRERKSPL